jgi:hypothetical protein
MDHDHHDWSPISTRGVLRWPEQARVALCVVVNLEHMEWEPPQGHFEASRLAGGLGRLPYPDYARLTHREYGHRVGIFRLLDVLEKHAIPATIAMDALTAEHYPYLLRHCLDRGCEMIGHGVSVSRMITSGMSEKGGAGLYSGLDPGPQPSYRQGASGLARPGVWRVNPHATITGCGRYSLCV